MLRTELVQVWKAYNSLKATKEVDGKPVRRDTDFSFDMNYNLKTMEPEIEGIKALEEQQQELENNFQKKRLEIIKTKALIDEDTKEPVVEDNKYKFPSKEAEAEFIKELQPLLDEYNKEAKVEIDKYNEFMLNEVSTDIESKLKRHKRSQLDKQLTDEEAQGLLYITD